MDINSSHININKGNVQRIMKDLLTGKTSKHLITSDGWRTMITDGVVPPIFMDTFADDLDWELLVKFQKIPEELLEKYSNRLNWKLVCIHQEMSEEFMINHQDKLSWKEVYYCQEYSDDFYKEFESHLKFYKDQTTLNKHSV